MVRFRPRTDKFLLFFISIPQWFYSNSTTRRMNVWVREIFQYHTGSIQTFIFFFCDEKNCAISIPHWFYSNNKLNKDGLCSNFIFQYHTGSIQTLRGKPHPQRS